jgi:TolB-like protein
MLTRADFDAAVRDALRHYTRADLLVRNPLLQTRIATGRGAKQASVTHLQQALAGAAETIFVNERDQKRRRVLDLAYFQCAAKQEAIAERLGLPFSTYRRHLTTAVERLSEWLWHEEQTLQNQGDSDEDIGAPPQTSLTDQPDPRPRLSIAVLPFLNLSQDPDLDYVVDGIVDNLMTDLSRALPGSFVISRSTAFTYKGRRVPIRQIGEELQVRYVLEGSVLADAASLRVNAQLIDARTEEHLWAERFDKERRDILQVQDEIVARLSRSVGVEMVRNEARRSRSHGGDPDRDVFGNQQEVYHALLYRAGNRSCRFCRADL